MKLSLLVLRTPNLENMRTFYSALGAHFEKERHGNGPEHYAATLGDDLVLELYPTLDGAVPDTGLRLGLRVNDIEETLRAIAQSAAPQQTQWGLRAIVRDPDGRKVELLESRTERTSAGSSQLGRAIA
jgi:catechol 2,3-dioxygenase-like lactoylglutathione lyase family enzyme